MELQKTVLEIRYTKIPNQFLFHNRLFKAITGQEQAPHPVVNANLNVKIEDKKASVLVQPDRTIINIELTDTDVVSGFLVAVVERLNGMLAFDDVTWVGVRCMYMQKSKKDFATIKSEFKEKYIKNTAITDLANDFSLPLSIKLDKFNVNFTHGPMHGDELNNYMEYKKDNLPESYYFVDLDLYVKSMKISKRAMATHITEVFATHEELISKL